jgi:hypothetical protein
VVSTVRLGELSTVLLVVALCGCENRSSQLMRPAPPMAKVAYICGNKGRYMSPFTPDGTLSKWVDKGLNIKAGTLTGMSIGGVAGKVVAPNSPLGAVFAASVGAAVGRELAIELFGGWDYIRDTTQMSFDHLDEMAVYLYREFHDKPTYANGMKAAFLIYPRLREVYPVVVREAVTGGAQPAASPPQQQPPPPPPPPPTPTPTPERPVSPASADAPNI